MKYNILLIASAMFSIGMMIAAPWFVPKPIYLSLYAIIGLSCAIIIVAIVVSHIGSKR